MKFQTVLTIFFLACLAVSAQTPAGTIEGQIVGATTGAPVPGATVRVEQTQLGAIADPQGKFVVRNVPPGVYTLRVNAIGYAPFLESNVAVGSGKPATVTIRLVEQDIQLEGIEVEASYFQRNVETVTSTQLLSAEDIRRAPGVQEDVVRAVQLLPGVAVTSAGRNDLIVRGGAPFENLFIVDNIEVPNINHFGSQGSTGGPLSLINIDFVRETDFSTGGFGVQYGDKLSSLTNIVLRDGSAERFGGEVNLSATGFGVIGEGPLGENTTFLVSVRRSYLDFIFKAAGFGFIPEYWDVQTKVSHKIDNKNSLSFLAIGALDDVTFNNDDADKRFDNSRVAAPNQKQYFSGLTWKHLLDNGVITTTLGRTYTTFSTYQNDSLENRIFQNLSTEGENSLRTDVLLLPADGLDLNFGAVLKLASTLDYDILLPGVLRRDNNGVERPLTVDTNFSAFRTALYAQASYTVLDGLRVTAGLHSDYYAYLADKFFLSPRFGLRYGLTSVSALTASVGRYTQSPSFIWLTGDPGNSSLKPAVADQVVLGYEHLFAPDLKFQIEGYYKQYRDYFARIYRPQAVLSPSGFDDATRDIPYGLEPLSNNAEGTSRGVEIFLQKKLSEIPLYGLMSISLNQTRFTSIDGVERPGSYDSRFILNILGGYRLGSDWEISSKFRFSTGLPTTPFTNTGAIDFTRYNAGERLPSVHTLDLRVDKRWSFTGLQLITYIDIQNIYGRKNISGIQWNARTQQAEYQESIGVLPSVGINIEF